ncbi:AfsR/SARP family transcriptional regulator [Catelliglobosispora koreensis]|uniref:AfsR/SARP family transcriptional regulator n=1 Tax=Catelliglobosispora koreensis TaxID=129052 RepID=UPI00047706DC|nr:AfsR/SARP family transcriptional regulator [Catelliglobosispora koreensis]
MEVRILGPIDLLAGGNRVHLGGQRQQIVLAMLALELGRVVPVYRLIDAIWDESPPQTARDQVQICVSGLRRKMAVDDPKAITTHASGYQLRLKAEELDLGVFDVLSTAAKDQIAEGDLSAAAQSLRNAEATWRGSALDGLPGRVMDAARAQLHERRMAATQERIRVELALGRHHEVIAELMILVTEHPLREQFHSHLMLALHRAGRSAEALEAYRVNWRIRTTELGIDPGEEIKRIEQAILSGSPILDLPANAVRGEAAQAPAAGHRVPRLLPRDTADFTGRQKLVTEIRDLLGPAMPDAQPVRVIVICGPGGIGKSTLAIHIAHELRENYPDGQLFTELRGSSTDPLSPAQALARLLRALGVAGQAIPDGVPQRAEMFRDRLAEHKVIIVLDDAMDAAQIMPLLPGSSSSAVLVTTRGSLTGVSGMHQVNVEVFQMDQSHQLLSRIAGEDRIAAEREAATELAKLCGHLPLALRIAGARLASRPHWTVEQLVSKLADESRRLDELVHGELQIRSSIELSYTTLDERGRQLLRLLAIMRPGDFASWVAAPLLDCSLEIAEEELDRLVDARLLEAAVPVPGQAARYRFHELVRVFSRERLSADDPVAVKDAANRCLRTWMTLVEEAHRRVYGGDYTVLHGNTPRWPLPRKLLDRLLVRPMSWWESEREAVVAAIRLAAAEGLDDLCWDLCMTTVTLFEARGYFDEWRECAEIGLQATRRAGNHRGEAAMLHTLGAYQLAQQQTAKAETYLQQSLRLFESLSDRHGQGLVLRNLAYLDRIRNDVSSAEKRYGLALRALREVGDRVAEAHVLSNQAQLRLADDDLEGARALLDESLAICKAVGSHRVETQARHRLGELLLQWGDLDAAEDAFHWVLRRVRDSGDRVGESYAMLGLGTVHQRQQREDPAELVLSEAIRLARQLGEFMVAAKATYTLGELDRGRQRWEGAASHFAAAEQMFADIGAIVWRARAMAMLCEMRMLLGDSQGAAEGAALGLAMLSRVDSAEALRIRQSLLRLGQQLPEG